MKNITFSRDFYFSITPDKCEEIDPATHGTSYSLYVEDNTGLGGCWRFTAMEMWNLVADGPHTGIGDEGN